MLIIYAHPNHEGHCGYFLQKIEKLLKEKGVDYKTLDLYQLDFDPVLKNEEHYTSGRTNITKQNREIQKMIAADKRFVFIYPVWWNCPPAILKGFFDRIFTSKFAFIYKNGYPWGLLQGKASVFCSSGSPIFFRKFFLGDRAVKLVTKDLLNFCGIKSRAFPVGSATKLTERQKRKIDKQVKKGMKWILG